METAAVTVGEALIGLEERRLLLTQLPGYVWTTDAVLRVTSIVGAPTAMLAPPAGLVGQRLLDLYESPAEAAPAVEAHRRALAGACVAYEVERNGRVFAARVEPLRADGEIVGIVGVAHELTETRRRDERWRRLVEDVDVVLWEADLRRLEVTYVSPVVERLLGFPVERASTRTISGALPIADSCRTKTSSSSSTACSPRTGPRSASTTSSGSSVTPTARRNG